MKPEESPSLYYSDYLELDKILGAQHPKSGSATDETLFIVIHQAYELWFKMIIHELDAARGIFSTDITNKELTEVGTFLIERSSLPELPRAVREKSSFNI